VIVHDFETISAPVAEALNQQDAEGLGRLCTEDTQVCLHQTRR
jgi:hypothetical protein